MQFLSTKCAEMRILDPPAFGSRGLRKICFKFLPGGQIFLDKRKKIGILVFREDLGMDLVSFYRDDMISWSLEKVPRFVTFKAKREIWTIPFAKFLKVIKRRF